MAYTFRELGKKDFKENKYETIEDIVPSKRIEFMHQMGIGENRQTYRTS